MRLKERKDNWRSHAIVKRDFKHDHSDLSVIYSSHKNKSKWCKGKVGVKHNFQWHKETWLFGINMLVGECATCGKHMYRDYQAKQIIV